MDPFDLGLALGALGGVALVIAVMGIGVVIGGPTMSSLPPPPPPYNADRYPWGRG